MVVGFGDWETEVLEEWAVSYMFSSLTDPPGLTSKFSSIKREWSLHCPVETADWHKITLRIPFLASTSAAQGLLIRCAYGNGERKIEGEKCLGKDSPGSRPGRVHYEWQWAV
jgi:hypothetical protein